MSEMEEAIGEIINSEAGMALVQRTPILAYFTFAHLPPHLRVISASLASVAYEMVTEMPPSAELTAGLRKLLEAKDCFVRAAVTASASLKQENQNV